MNSGSRRTEGRLRLELEKSLPLVDFDPVLHGRYRDATRNERRLTRTLYYLVPVILFGVMSFSASGRAAAQADFSAFLGRMELGLFLPVFLLVAVANSGRVPDPVSSWLHVAASLGMWSGILALQYEAWSGVAHLPPGMLGVALLCAALLCGFRLRPMLLGIAVFTLLDLLLEWQLAVRVGDFTVDALLVAALGGCAAAAARIAEASRRRLWIAGQIADFAARSDPLTGLVTRAEFNLRFPLMVAQGRREHQPISLMLIAIDDFRAINEKLGHIYGDLVLHRVAEQILLLGKRPLDLKARFAGGKLAIGWYDCKPQAAGEMAMQLLQAVRGIELERPASGAAPHVTLSAGVLSLLPDERTSPLNMLKIADALMYQARSAGRDRAVIRNLIDDGEQPQPLGAATVPS